MSEPNEVESINDEISRMDTADRGFVLRWLAYSYPDEVTAAILKLRESQRLDADAWQDRPGTEQTSGRPA